MGPRCLSPLLPMPGGHHWRPVQICSFEDLLPTVLRLSGGHQNTYGWQAGGTLPTEMLSCFLFCRMGPNRSVDLRCRLQSPHPLPHAPTENPGFDSANTLGNASQYS